MIRINADGSEVAGPLDVLCVLQRKPHHFRVALFTSPLWANEADWAVHRQEDIDLKVKMFHPKIARTLTETRECLEEMRQKFQIPERNVAYQPLPWDGQLNTAWRIRNWLKYDESLDLVLETVRTNLKPMEVL